MPIEETNAFAAFGQVAGMLWKVILEWDWFAKRIYGTQLMKAIEGVGANLVEGDGRYSDAEALHFFEIARGSARESLFWINRVSERGLLSEELTAKARANLEDGIKMLNGLISYRRSTKNVNRVREETAEYPMPPSAAPKRQAPNAKRQENC